MGYSYGNNVYLKKITNSNSRNSNIKVITNSQVNNQTVSYNNCTLYYLVTYWSDGTVDYEYLGSSCIGGGCEETKVLSKDSTLFIKSLCADGSGGGGSSGDPANIYDVKNNLKDSCFNSIVNLMINSNLKNTVTNILQNVFGTSKSPNLTFDESSNIVNKSGYPIPAQTSPSFDQSTNILNLSTKIRLDQFEPSASREYKAAVMIHEIIHANIYIDTTVLKGLTQHAYMLENYVGNISTSLQGFFANLTPKQALSLALGGLSSDLSNTPAFDTVLVKYGFNNISTSTDNYAYFLQKFEYGTIGSQCTSSSSGGKHEEN
jgi:hypothetical protein